MFPFRREGGGYIDRKRLVTKPHAGNIVFLNYPFRPASIFPDGFVRAADIRDIDPAMLPPEVRLKSGEILFAYGVDPAELEKFAQHNHVPLVKRRDVWHDLMEPYLDTQISESQQQETLRRLEKQGFTLEEIERIRKRLKRPMISYNVHAWEEYHLGLFEALEAVARKSFSWNFKKFYAEAMVIANRGTKVG